jgi:RNAse (barnase) inhibitor barstar
MTAEQVNAADLRWRWDQAVPLRWLLVDEFTMMNVPGTAVAVCADVDGLFVGEPTVPGIGCPAASGLSGLAAGPARLIGCRPGQPLRAALDALARGAGAPGGALWRRQVSASIYSVAEDGTAVHLPGNCGLHASVTAACPSPLGEGLLDVTFDAAITDPMPCGASQIWELWRAGRPTKPGLWVDYDSGLRHQWSGAALAHHQPGTPDKPAGTTYHLDGLNVTDLAGFYCAIGEAINGPGGYFGWNADALHDCLIGGWGAARPFRLIWHDASIARAHFPAAFDQVLQWLTQDGIVVELR